MPEAVAHGPGPTARKLRQCAPGHLGTGDGQKPKLHTKFRRLVSSMPATRRRSLPGFDLTCGRVWVPRQPVKRRIFSGCGGRFRSDRRMVWRRAVSSLVHRGRVEMTGSFLAGAWASGNAHGVTRLHHAQSALSRMEPAKHVARSCCPLGGDIHSSPPPERRRRLFREDGSLSPGEVQMRPGTRISALLERVENEAGTCFRCPAGAVELTTSYSGYVSPD